MKQFFLAIALAGAFSVSVFAGGSADKKAAASYPATVTVSYVESPFNLQCMVMRDRGMLEQAFAAKGVKVKWVDINSGAEQTQAMAAGSLDIATVINTTSIILANAAGNKVDIAGIVSRPKQSFALMVGADGPATIEALKGKTVAGPKGTVLHQMLLAALVSKGMTMNDVRFMQMGIPEARSALLSGQIDGALQAAATIIRDKAAGARVLFTADGYLNPVLYSAVRPAFAEQYPDLLQLYLDTQKRAYQWILANTDEAIAICCKYQDISKEDGEDLYAWNGMTDTFEAADMDALKADEQFLLAQGMIDHEVNVATFCLPTLAK
jgi:ABC-type nitrate/sulfonate/bicarbonate transport system substrate-binding protein